MVRLLQKYEQITLAPDAQPVESLPPPEWKNGQDRRRVEQIWPKNHLTTYAHVSFAAARCISDYKIF